MKKEQRFCCLQETQFKNNDSDMLIVRESQIIYHSKSKPKKVGVAILILDIVYLKTKSIT